MNVSTESSPIAPIAEVKEGAHAIDSTARAAPEVPAHPTSAAAERFPGMPVRVPAKTLPEVIATIPAKAKASPRASLRGQKVPSTPRATLPTPTQESPQRRGEGSESDIESVRSQAEPHIQVHQNSADRPELAPASNSRQRSRRYCHNPFHIAIDEDLEHQYDIRNGSNLLEDGNPIFIINSINRLRIAAEVEPADKDQSYAMFNHLAEIFRRTQFTQTHVLVMESYLDRISVSLLNDFTEYELLSACVLLTDKQMLDPAAIAVRNSNMADVLGLSSETLSKAELAVLKNLEFRMEPMEFKHTIN